MGRILLGEGNARGALAAFESGIQLWPNNAVGRFLAGQAAERVGDFPRAISHYRESFRTNPGISEAGRAQVRRLVDHYLENARLLRDGCDAIGLTAYGGADSPYVWVACPDGLSSWQMFDRMLDEARVVVTPGVGFGRCGEGYIRISAFNTRDNVLEVVKRLHALTAQVR